MIVKEMKERNETVNTLEADFSSLGFVRDIVVSSQQGSSYPDYVREALNIGVNPPLIFINTKLIVHGAFPEYSRFKTLIVEHM